MKNIVDREREQQLLQRLFRSKDDHIALVFGRRRVGKTFLLTQMWNHEDLFHFTASAVTAEQNRAQLVSEIAQWTGEKERSEDYSSWRAIFRRLLNLRKKKTIVVLDEFQYLGEEYDLAGVASDLNAEWERTGRSGQVLLVLSGSEVGVLEGLDGGGAPLHGRFSATIKLEPFDYLDAASLARFRSQRDAAVSYAAFGGTPRYLAPIDAKRGLEENICDLMVDRHGEVRNQVQTAILQEQGLREIAKYRGVLHAIGSGRTDLSRIADRVGLDKNTDVRTKVEKLVELGYVDRRRNYGASKTSAWQFQLSDPAFRFYHRFVVTNESALEHQSTKSVWKKQIAPYLDSYMGHLFEKIVEEAAYRNNDLLIAEWGRWEGNDRHRKSLEIDIVTRLTSGEMLTGAIKWNAKKVGPICTTTTFETFSDSQTRATKWAHDALKGPLLYVSASGFSSKFEKRVSVDEREIVLWKLSDLYDF